ncbi:MFS transporter [Lichenicoccus roseus]|uniref:MHS family MFS transporter n=1 Tax=Lichenicoccus roseus TaxID=2683649 RepID=A0A5R9JAA5_9PROT|nr:MFS transporter [Lichenicoccus roseus]TLU73929.1 MHS family MFS transporter [Lichenicoccus roseus]
MATLQPQVARGPGAGMNLRVIVASVIGNSLEWYDFTVYAFLATIIGHHFFPHSSPTVALLQTFAVFGVGFVARPLGGVSIGLFGDRLGRKPALLLTVGLMAAGTGLIGILPGYASIGVWAPVLLVLARALQGFSAGGEWGSSASFLVEWAPASRRGLYGSFHPGSIFLGQLVGTAVADLLVVTLGSADMQAWGWRVPFLLGALIGPLGLLARRRIGETPVFVAAQATAATDAPVTRLSAGKLVFAFCFVSVQSVGIYLYLSFFPTFLQHYAGWTAHQALSSTVLATIATGCAVVCSGALSDRIGRKPVLLFSCLVFLLLSYPLVWLILHGATHAVSVLIQCVLSANCGLFIGSMTAALVEMFPTRSRLTGLSTSYNLASMVFGGFAPFIATWLIAATGAAISVTYYVILGAIVSLPAVLLFRETAGKPLD